MTISLELSFYAGLIVSFPILIFLLAQFLFPALKPTERRILMPVSVFGLFLFLAGVLFAYFVVLPGTLDFFFKDAKSMHWTPTWTVREYYSFTTQFLIAFGVAFEMPMVVLALVKLGVLTAEKLRKTRSAAIIVIFTVAAFVTPSPDLVTYLLMGGRWSSFMKPVFGWLVGSSRSSRYRLSFAGESGADWLGLHFPW